MQSVHRANKRNTNDIPWELQGAFIEGQWEVQSDMLRLEDTYTYTDETKIREE